MAAISDTSTVLPQNPTICEAIAQTATELLPDIQRPGCYEVALNDQQRPHFARLLHHILPDTDWILDHLQQGYCFTILAPETDMLTVEGRDGSLSRETAARRIHYRRSLLITLIVRQNGRFVPCDEVFLPSANLCSPSRSIESQAARQTKPAFRAFHIRYMGIKINLALPQSFESATQPFWIDCHSFLPWLKKHPVLDYPIEHKLSYMSLGQNKWAFGRVEATHEPVNLTGNASFVVHTTTTLKERSMEMFFEVD